MALLQRIRNRGTLLMIIVGFALLLFILGAVLENSSSSGRVNVVGEIDGNPISYEDFRSKVELDLRNRKGGTSAKERERIELDVWDNIVKNIVLGKEMEELGLAVTNQELSSILLDSSNINVKSSFGDKEPAEIAKQVSDIETKGSAYNRQQLLFFKQYLRKQRLEGKYSDLISQGLAPTPTMIKELNILGKADFKYVMKGYNAVPDSVVDVSESEIKEYYNLHKEQFKQKPTRKITYIQIKVKPSQEDKEFAEKSIEKIKSRFNKSKDPMRFASVNSDNKTNEKYLTKKDVKDSLLVKYAFSKDVNSAYGPYEEKNMLYLTRVVDSKMLSDSVKASHILIKPGSKEKIIDSLVNLLKKGANFGKLAKKFSDGPTANKGGALGWFKKGQMVPEFEKATFENIKKGRIGTAKTRYGTHIIKVIDKSPLKKNVKLATVSKEIVPSNKTFQIALTEARHIAENISTTNELLAVAKEKKLKTETASFNTASTGLGNIPNSKALVRAAFRTDNSNELLFNQSNSTVFELDESYVIAGLTKATSEGYATLEEKRDYIKRAIRIDKKTLKLKEELAKATKGAKSLDDLATKENLTIKDFKNASFENFYVQLVGYAVFASALLEKLPENGLSRPVDGNRGVFVLGNIVKEEAKKQSADKAIKTYKDKLFRRISDNGYKALYENVEIKDERYKF